MNKYILKSSFATKNEFEEWFANDKENWTRRHKHDGIRFETELMYCRYSRRQGNKCPAVYKIEANKETGEVKMFQKDEHFHDEELISGFTKEERIFMKARKKLTAGQIQDAFLMRSGNAPKLRQIQNFQQREKSKDGFNKAISVEEIQRFATENSTVPAGPNAPYLIKASIEAADSFCLVWSTRKLMKMQKKHGNLSIDATYKILSYGFPILRAGITDANGKFFPTAIAISSNEDGWAYIQFFTSMNQPDVLMADGALAITNAQEMVWPGTIRSNCFFHVMKNIKEKFATRQMKAAGEQILDEVKILQRAACSEEFEEAARVLNNEWAKRLKERPEVLEILNGFVNFYVKDPANNGWYAGHNQFCNTNNSLERANREFKDREMGRRRVPIREFFEIAANAVYKWSINPDLQNPSTKPEIKLDVFQKAFQLQKEGRMIVKIRDDERFLIPSKSGCADFDSTEQLLAAYAQLYDDGEGGKNEPVYDNWKAYMDLRAKFYVVFKVTVWNKDFYLCTCSVGSKMKACKHSVLLMCDMNLATYPAEITATLIEPKRKKGRPKKSLRGSALARN